MLQFEYIDSPFYEKNKFRCLKLQEQLISLGFEVKGYCNAWGYEINAFNAISKEAIKIEKGSNTGRTNGSIFHGFTYKGNFKSYSLRLKFKRSFLFRYFMDAEYKSWIPSPYYIKANESVNYGLINALDKFRNNSDTFEMTINKGIMKVSFNDKVEDMPVFLEGIERIKKII